ncbi:MAG: factor-independent urate hydroxylase [bacterium]
MPVILSQNCYGKSSVRVAKVTRHADHHDLKEVAVNIQLAGAFEQVYCEGDNRAVLPTDTMKNTVYALAKSHALHTIEEFGLLLARHFLDNNTHLFEVGIELEETLWQRLTAPASTPTPKPHPHAFVSTGHETWTSLITQNRTGPVLRSGLRNLLILKTADSGFSEFLRDPLTTLKETDDRIFATDLQADWLYESSAIDFTRCRQIVQQALLETFAQHRSLSVQHTLYAMGQAALEQCHEVSEIHLVMPNKHYLLFDIERFGMENQNEIFVPTEEPFGRIEGTLRRG